MTAECEACSKVLLSGERVNFHSTAEAHHALLSAGKEREERLRGALQRLVDFEAGKRPLESLKVAYEEARRALEGGKP